MLFNTVELHGRQKLAVRNLRKTIAIATYADEPLNIRIPWREVLVSYRPIATKSIARVGFKVVFAPPLRHARPKQRLPSDLVSPDPAEGLYLHVGMFIVFDEKMFGVFVKCITLADDGIGADNVAGQLVPMWKLPGVHRRGGIILYVDDVSTAF